MSSLFIKLCFFLSIASFAAMNESTEKPKPLEFEVIELGQECTENYERIEAIDQLQMQLENEKDSLILLLSPLPECGLQRTTKTDLLPHGVGSKESFKHEFGATGNQNSIGTHKRASTAPENSSKRTRNASGIIAAKLKTKHTPALFKTAFRLV